MASNAKTSTNEDGKEASATDSEGDFVNTGFERWQQVRKEWLKPTADGKMTKGEVRAKSVDIEDVIERIYSQSSAGTLREPLPLGQMIDLLIDFWEADGLYD